MLLYAEGYRPEKANAHYRRIDSLPQILGPKFSTEADYLNSCRSIRNTLECEHVGEVDESDVQELIKFVEDLKAEVIAYLSKSHPGFKPRSAK